MGSYARYRHDRGGSQLGARTTAVLTLPIISAATNVLLPLAIGFTIAYVLTPVVDAAQRIKVNRAFATAVLFGVFLSLSVAILSLAVPAVIRQSSDLAARSFQDNYYLDRNADGGFDQDEPVLRELSEQPGTFFHDRNTNCVPIQRNQSINAMCIQCATRRGHPWHSIGWTTNRPRSNA